MSFKDIYLNYRCPRYEMMPSIALYKDQLVSVLEEYISPFSTEEKLITSSMINNYVKLKIIKPPVNKKYDREQLSFLYIICLLKRFMPIEQICKGFEFVLKHCRMGEAYNIFCDELENALQRVFGGEPLHEPAEECEETDIIRSVTNGLANFVFANVLIKTKEEKK